ncbi:hypothetical protein AX17_005001 [Amanita inopinata Kibby_2008]|nr:hypothetical protein AX17_005001 [Amanita inopinata Kibby_2008]
MMVSPSSSPKSSAAQPPNTRPSPPATPNQPSTPPSDDSSEIEDLSFEWIVDDNGNYVRLSKGSPKSNNSSPPTPYETSLHPEPPPSPPPRASLSRSESAYSLPTAAATDKPSARNFQRVASGPSLSMTPNFSTATSSSRPRTHPRRMTSEDANSREQDLRKYDFPSRSRPMLDSHQLVHQEEKENISEAEEPPYHPSSSKLQRHSPPLSSRPISGSSRSTHQLASRMTYSSSSHAISRSLADVSQRASHPRQILPGPNRPGRVVKSASGSAPMIATKYSSSSSVGIEKIPEHEGSESEFGVNDHLSSVAAGDETDTGDEEPVADPLSSLPSQGTSLANVGRQRSLAIMPVASSSSLGQSHITRPRRSASLSDALVQEDPYHLQVQQQPLPPYSVSGSRPGTSLGSNPNADNTGGPRRVTVEEWERQEMEMRKRMKRETEEFERREQDLLQHSARQSPSPTHGQHSQVPSLKHLGHRRRDSDTLRNVSPSLGSPTAVELPSRISPSSGGRLARDVATSAKHRRSPTAPDPPTNCISHKEAILINGTGKAEDGGALSSSERERGRTKAQIALEAQHQQQKYMQAAGHAPPPPSTQLNRHMVVNKKAYARLDMIGKGGSSRVFRVLNHANELYAIKRVSLDKTDSETMSGYMNEIALLKRLDGNSRIIRLIDSEVKAGPGGSKGHLLLVMECGEIDLARLLTEQMKDPLNMVWVAYYWQQMLQAVHVIHEEKIVHSDLKPANFVLVRGQLKLIDFGIANAIANDTTNIQRDHQIGTVNYMSPEAIELPDGMRRLKVGRPSDVWSLGCILYQMIYGQPPFQHLSVYQKMKAIPDGSHVIDFPEHSVPQIPASRSSSDASTPPRKLDHLKRRVRRDVIASMKSCLCRSPKERATIPELLEQDWLAMKEPEPPSMRQMLASDETIINPYYMRQLLEYGIKLGKESKGAGMSSEALLREAERLVAELKSTVFSDLS